MVSRSHGLAFVAALSLLAFIPTTVPAEAGRIQEHSLVAGGRFPSAGGVASQNIVAWNPVRDRWSSFSSGADGSVDAMAILDSGSGPELYAAGEFVTVGGIPADGIAKWNPDTESWTSIASSIVGQIYALAAFVEESGPVLYAGGTFSAIDGVACSHVARFDPVTRVWSPVGLGLDDNVNTLAVVQMENRSTLFAGGQFEFIGDGTGADLDGIARWDSVAATWQPLPGAPMNSVVNVLRAVPTASGDELWVGSSTLKIWDPRSGTWTDGNAGSGVIFALESYDEDRDGNADRVFVGLVDNITSVVVASRTAESLENGVDGRVEALLVLDDGTGPALYVGGRFSNVRSAGGTVPSRLFARWLLTVTPPRWDTTLGEPFAESGSTIRAFASLLKTEVDPPTVESIVPAAGGTCGGTQVTITGTSLFMGTVVRFDGIEASIRTVVNGCELVATAPPHAAGAVDVVVDSGLAPPVTLPAAFTYFDVDGRPSIESVEPSVGSIQGGTTVYVRGSDFCPGIGVFFGDEPAAAVRLLASATIEAVTPPFTSTCFRPGNVPVTVREPDGDSDTLDPGFSYTYGPVLHVGGDPRGGCRGTGAPGDPFTCIQSAIDAAAPGTTILIDPRPASGVYRESVNTRGKSLVLASADPNVFAPIMPPAGRRAVTVDSGEGPDTVIACLELTSGGGGILIANGSSPTIFDNEIHDATVAGDGGGILVTTGSSPTIRGNRIHDNIASGDGGGIATRDEGTAPRIEGNYIYSKCSARNGGGIAVLPGSRPALLANDINGNQASGNGGGLYIAPGSRIEEVSGHGALGIGAGRGIRRNSAGGDGGGIYCGADAPGSLPALERRIRENDVFANAAMGLGAGICIQGGSMVRIEGNTIAGNNPDNGEEEPEGGSGGGIACDSSAADGTSLVIRGNRIEGNRSPAREATGGGLFLRGARDRILTAFVERNLICANTAQSGGGVTLDTKIRPAILRRNVIAFNRSVPPPPPPGEEDEEPPTATAPGILERDCLLRLENNTIHRNTNDMGGAEPYGGGLHAEGGLFADSGISNNVFSENGGYAIRLVDTNPFVPIEFNHFFANELGTCTGDCGGLEGEPQDEDPLFVDGSRCDRLQLQAGSPCIDAGDPEDSSPCDARIDIGAFEFCESMALRYGSVNRSAGVLEDVLAINGETGDEARELTVNAGSAIEISILRPSGGGSGRFVVHADVGSPDSAASVGLPFGAGQTVFPFLVGDGARPAAVWNGLGRTARLGQSRSFLGDPMSDPPAAPCRLLAAPRGSESFLPVGTVVTFQGLIVDPRSSGSRRISVTNAVVVSIR